MIDASDHLRLANCVIASVCVAAMTFGMVTRRHKTPRRIRRIGAWVFAILSVNAYGSGYLYSRHADLNPAAVMLFLVLCGLGGALIWHPEGDDKFPPDDGALTNRFMAWLDGRVRKYKYHSNNPHGGPNA